MLNQKVKLTLIYFQLKILNNNTNTVPTFLKLNIFIPTCISKFDYRKNNVYNTTPLKCYS